MRNIIILAALGGPISLATPLWAEVTGGSLALSHSAYTDDTSVANTALEGSVEYGFSRNFSLQGDLGYNSFHDSDTHLTNATVHGIFHINPSTSLGGFVGVDSSNSNSSTVYGLEFGHAVSGQTGVEGYVAQNEDNGADLTQIGLSGRYEMTPQVGFGASLDYGNFDIKADVTRFAISADYAVADNLRLSAELGEVDAKAFGFGGSEAYVKLGAKITFGANRGTTFGTRSLSRLLPGY